MQKTVLAPAFGAIRMADIPARTEIGVTTGAIRGSRKIHVASPAIPGEPVARTQVESGIARDPSNLIPVIRAEGVGGFHPEIRFLAPAFGA